MYVLRAVIAPDDCDPVSPEAEKLGPVTVQLETSVALHEITDESPERTRVGFAVMERAGFRTVTVTESWHPAEHCNVYVFVVPGRTETSPFAAPPVEKLRPAEDAD